MRVKQNFKMENIFRWCWFHFVLCWCDQSVYYIHIISIHILNGCLFWFRYFWVLILFNNKIYIILMNRLQSSNNSIKQNKTKTNTIMDSYSNGDSNGSWKKNNNAWHSCSISDKNFYWIKFHWPDKFWSLHSFTTKWRKPFFFVLILILSTFFMMTMMTIISFSWKVTFVEFSISYFICAFILRVKFHCNWHLSDQIN